MAKALKTPSKQPLLDVAVLFKDIDASKGCSHVISWKSDVIREFNHCPVCMEPVGMVCDGNVASLEKSTNGDERSRIVRFKFGKKIFQLSLGERTDPSTILKDERSTGWLGLWGCGKESPSEENESIATLVQYRITQALNLASLKILYKGKVLYPPSPGVSQSTPLQDAEISDAILRISDENWNGNKRKAPLTVMGTSKESQLKEPMTDDGARHGGIFQLVQYYTWLPVTILSWSVRLSLELVKSFFEPLFSLYRLRDDNEDDNTRRTRQNRSHQD